MYHFYIEFYVFLEMYLYISSSSELIAASIINDSTIESLLLMQISDQNSRWDGGVKDIYQVPNAHSTMNFIIKLCSSYASPNSKFYNSQRLESAITRAMNYIILYPLL
mgnify:CR=1 FL=1